MVSKSGIVLIFHMHVYQLIFFLLYPHGIVNERPFFLIKRILLYGLIYFSNQNHSKKFELSLDKIYTTVYNQTYLELSIRNRSSSSFLKPHEIFIYGPYIYLFSSCFTINRFSIVWSLSQSIVKTYHMECK